jgi:hypothetical protein
MKKKTKETEIELSPPYYTEGHWDDILDEIETLEKFQPSSNMGSWWRQIKLDKLKAKLKYRKK